MRTHAIRQLPKKSGEIDRWLFLRVQNLAKKHGKADADGGGYELQTDEHVIFAGSGTDGDEGIGVISKESQIARFYFTRKARNVNTDIFETALDGFVKFFNGCIPGRFHDELIEEHKNLCGHLCDREKERLFDAAMKEVGPERMRELKQLWAAEIQAATPTFKEPEVSSGSPPYASTDAEWVKKAIESAHKEQEYKPEDLRNFPLPATSGLIPHRTVMLYMKVVSGYGNQRTPRSQDYYLLMDGVKFLVDMWFSMENKPVIPMVQVVDSSGVKRCYISEEEKEKFLSRWMEMAAAFNVQKLVAKKIKPECVEKAVEEIGHQLSFVERYCSKHRHGEEKVVFRRFKIWKDTHPAVKS